MALFKFFKKRDLHAEIQLKTFLQEFEEQIEKHKEINELLVDAPQDYVSYDFDMARRLHPAMGYFLEGTRMVFLNKNKTMVTTNMCEELTLKGDPNAYPSMDFQRGKYYYTKQTEDGKYHCYKIEISPKGHALVERTPNGTVTKTSFDCRFYQTYMDYEKTGNLNIPENLSDAQKVAFVTSFEIIKDFYDSVKDIHISWEKEQQEDTKEA